MSPSRATHLLLAALVFALSGCTAMVGTGGPVSVPKDSQQQCRSHCEGIGMSLAAVAIMANNVGCVCEPPGKATGGESAAITAGMATIAMQVQQQQQQQPPAGR
jgi:hypothetical protein